MKVYKFFRDHYILFAVYLTLIFQGRWRDLKGLYEFIKDPEELEIKEVDFEMYDPEEYFNDGL